MEAGAGAHVTVDARQDVFDRVVRTLVQGNVLRGSVYPVCVSAERVVQAEVVVGVAMKMGATAIAHGSTGAGNDQVRFDVAIRTLAPRMEVIAPVRDQGLSREEEVAWLRERGVEVEEKTSRYSVNAGMWGVTIGGGETHDAWESVPDDVFPNVVEPGRAPAGGGTVVVGFEKGVPVSVDGEAMEGPALVERVGGIGARHGVGRSVHIGDTILGIKGRVAFEAPAAMILIAAHRELEKLVLTRWQQFWKDKLGDFYGMLVHEASFWDPVARDIEAMISSSQQRVTGEARVLLRQGVVRVEGVRSPYSMMDGGAARYGETQSLWTGRDAQGFTRIYGLQGRLAAAAGEGGG